MQPISKYDNRPAIDTIKTTTNIHREVTDTQHQHHLIATND